MAAVIPAVTKISPRIIRVLGCNPGLMTLQGTNTYIIGTGKSRILIDTGHNDVPQYINHLKSVLKHEKIDLEHILITHWHHDHIGGLTDVLELKDKTANATIWKFPCPEHDSKIQVPIQDLKNGQEIRVEGATLKVMHTPGHTSDHVAFHLLEDNAIFSGDCILGEGTAVFEDLHDYISSLTTILASKPLVIYPGHGNIINDPVQKITFYIAHRLERETQILNILSNNRLQEFSAEDIVKMVYIDTPAKLLKAAENNVYHHLQKLLKEEKVKCMGNKWSMANDVY